MRNVFYMYNLEKIKEDVFKDNIIILDTNILLNLYRHGNDNRKKFLEILEKAKENIYLPYQVVHEFFQNKNDIISQKIASKEKAKKALEKAINEVKGISFYKKDEVLIEKLDKLLNESISILIKKEEEDEIKENYIVNEDKVLTKFFEIFEGKVNTKLLDEEILKIEEEGKDRYEKNIPPGYMDKKKGTNNCYGDLIIWKEIIKIAKKYKKNILFITDDEKEDWIETYNGMYISPRKELIKEFNEETHKNFWILKNNEFLKISSQKFKIENISDLKKEAEFLLDEDKKKTLDNELNVLENKINDSCSEITLSNGKCKVISSLQFDLNYIEELKKLEKNLKELIIEINDLLDDLKIKGKTLLDLEQKIKYDAISFEINRVIVMRNNLSIVNYIEKNIFDLIRKNGNFEYLDSYSFNVIKFSEIHNLIAEIEEVLDKILDAQDEVLNIGYSR